MELYSGTKSEQQVQLRENLPLSVRSEMARHLRLRALRGALPAMRALWAAGVPAEFAAECGPLYIASTVEHAYLVGDLGLFDQDRIAVIIDLFGMSPAAVEFIWHLAVDELMHGHDKRRAAAIPQFEAGHLAVIAHRPLVDLKACSRAFQKTVARDASLFGAKLVEPARWENGRRVKTKRVYTGMPNWSLPSEIVVRGVPDGPGSDILTTAERKRLVPELGVRIDTLRRRERELEPSAFETWLDRRRKTVATRAKRLADREARKGKRSRLPGRTAAVRSYMRRTDRSESSAWRDVRGLSVTEIDALGRGRPLVEMISQRHEISACDSDTAITNCHAICHADSDTDSDTDHQYPAKRCNSDPRPSLSVATDNASVTPLCTVSPKRRRAMRLQEKFVLYAWFWNAHGRQLSDATLRQWRRRGVLRDRIATAAEWYAERDQAAFDEQLSDEA